MGFDKSQVAAARSGEVVSRLVPTREDSDVVVAGAVRLRVPKEAVVDDIKALRAFWGGRLVSAGRFGDPARVEDLAGLALDRQDVADLRKCRPGDCDLKLGEAGMEIAKRVNWKAPGAAAEAEKRLKEVFVEAIEAYRTRGEMVVYLDNESPEHVAQEIDKVVEDSPRPGLEAPLLRYALDFPRSALPGSEDFFYWSKVRLQKPVVSLHHLIIQKEVDGPAIRYHVADKHLLDSHYFLGRLDVVTITDDGANAEACYVTRLSRTRIDPPRRFRGMLLRKIKARMKEAMAEDLRLMKARLPARGASR